MKNYLIKISLAVAALLLTACTAERRASTSDVTRIDRLGHSYLVFELSGKFGANILHDPDCKSHKGAQP